MSNEPWPPGFSLDQEKILNLLTGDRFYSNPSAALREAILNAIDAVHRRQNTTPNFYPDITVTFDRDKLALTVADNGIGMGKAEINAFFVKVGVSAATEEAKKESVGEFGIGVISYFMAGNTFEIQTYDGKTDVIGLSFSRELLSGGQSEEIPVTQQSQGTTVSIQIRDTGTFDVLLDSFPHWCRDVDGLSAQTLPDGDVLLQGEASIPNEITEVKLPQWIERAHLGPVSGIEGWEAMTGISTVAVLYRGVFVQKFEVKRLWGIEGSIDVDPKHFKPRLNREGFVEGQFQEDVREFLETCHPIILEALVKQLKIAFESGSLDKWTTKRWANLWLSLPREQTYLKTITVWDSIFRLLPAFELAVGNQWQPASVEKIMKFQNEVFVAPLPDEKPNDVVQAALRLLRNTGRAVIRGIRRDKSLMRHVSYSFSTTADLITSVFAPELPQLVPITEKAEQILAQIKPVAPLFTGPPTVDLVKLGPDSPPVLRLQDRLIINLDHESGKALVEDVLRANNGQISLITSAARHTYEQLSQVAAVVRGITGEPEILGPIRIRYIRSLL